MTKTELAQMLGISASMVSRLAKRGMPVDDVDKAKRWRKRHLEPGRVKGMRVDTIVEPVQPLAPAAPTKPTPDLAGQLAVIERLGQTLATAIDSEAVSIDADASKLRTAMKAADWSAFAALVGNTWPRPCLPANTWHYLLAWALADKHPLMLHLLAAPVDQLLCPDQLPRLDALLPPSEAMHIACDWGKSSESEPLIETI